jgi:hypothetical protein
VDELADRTRQLDAERLRPERDVTLPDLLAELIATIHRAYLTPPDEHQGCPTGHRPDTCHMTSDGVT